MKVLAYLVDGEVFYPEPGDAGFFATMEMEDAQPIISTPEDPHGLQQLRETLARTGTARVEVGPRSYDIQISRHPDGKTDIKVWAMSEGKQPCFSHQNWDPAMGDSSHRAF